FEEQQRYLAFQAALEKDYPIYFEQKYHPSQTTLADLQAILDEKGAVIEFFQGEQQIYAALITKQSLHIHKTVLQEGYQEQVHSLLKIVSDNATTPTAFADFGQLASSLYEQLLGALKIPAHIEQLTIIPDKDISRIPFQTLLKHPVKSPIREARYDTLSYLVQDYELNYAYASALLTEQVSMQCSNAALTFGGFAPLFNHTPSFTRNGERLGRLLSSMTEVQQIAALLDGEIYSDTIATREHFIKRVSKHRILHLATHANLNAHEPMESEIHFIDTSLTVREIYNLPICAELAVLSACETASGELKKGEGILSLARAFAFAGCPSLVASLWKVNDKRTSEIMFDFYTALKAGKTKSASIRQAQINYFDNINSYSEAHPYYWAAFVTMGNAEAIFDTPFPYWWWAVAFLVLVVVLTLVMNYRLK
ncbi:MAG: CHAT domain-containing protein, partial [Bacteroidota bacterium]